VLKWNRKVPKHLIARLYNQSVSGICDDDLADDVGFALLVRCESIITVTTAYEKKLLKCPVCENMIPLINKAFKCSCGFSATWEEFRSSYKEKQLYAANALPIFVDFVNKFPLAKTYGEKLIAIDMLIHAFHINAAYERGLECEKPSYDGVDVNRPTGANLIEGKLTEVILFLDELSSIEGYSNGKEQWKNVIGRANGGSVLTKAR
jgi:hypothetical protein